MEEEKMNQEIQKMYEQHGTLREKTGDFFTSLRVENIKEIRNLIRHWILISSAIVGFSVTVLGNNQLVKNKDVLLIGLLSFLFLIIFAFYYLNNIVAKENRELKEQQKLYNEVLDEMRENVSIFILSDKREQDYNEKMQKDKEALDKLKLNEKDNDKRDYMLDLFFILFIVGLGAMVLSLTNWI